MKLKIWNKNDKKPEKTAILYFSETEEGVEVTVVDDAGARFPQGIMGSFTNDGCFVLNRCFSIPGFQTDKDGRLIVKDYHDGRIINKDI